MKHLFALVFAAASLLTVSAAQAEECPAGTKKVKVGTSVNEKGELVTHYRCEPIAPAPAPKNGYSITSIRGIVMPINKK